MTPCTRRLALLAMVLASTIGHAQTVAPPSTSVRVRGTVQGVGDETLTVRDRSGELLTLLLPPTLVVSEVYPVARSEIRAGSFIGTAAMPQADGSRRAVAVMVFPEAARGTGEGDRAFDLAPQSTMTNATVSEVTAVGGGREMWLTHKGGATRIVVPDDAPVVSFRRADRSLLVVGASVSIAAQLVDGKPTATRVNAGRDGFVLPY